MHIPGAARSLLTEAIPADAHAGEVGSGVVAGVVDAAGSRDTLAVGRRRLDGDDLTVDTLFDLASLTKVVATLPSVLRLVAAGELSLEDKVGRFFSSAGWFQEPSLSDVTVRSLLTHSSGLPAWQPLFAQVSTRRSALAAVLQTPVGPPGEVVYSDLGFMLLGAIVERVAHERLDAFVAREVFDPLDMLATRFGPLDGDPVAATEDCGWRGTLLEGQVHDENATVWNDVAGHAGLFGTVGDLLRYVHAWLTLDARLGPEELLREAVSEQVVARDAALSTGRRGLGWLLARPGVFAGEGASGFGHTGFTGTSLWVDPEAGYAVVLLSNRVHPRRGPPARIHALRVAFHDAVRSGFEGTRSAP